MSQEPLPNPEATLAHYQAQAGMAQLLREKDLEIERWKSLAERLQAQADEMRGGPQWNSVEGLAVRWTGYPDADLALILLGRLDAPEDEVRVQQLEEIVMRMGNLLAAAPTPTNGVSHD